MKPAGTAVVVLGMHRAGTSLTAKLLELAGVYLGDELFPAQPGVNDKGFWENRRVVEFNDDLLLATGSSWDDWLSFPSGCFAEGSSLWFQRHLEKLLRRQFAGRPIWGVKDPRICRLLPLWQRVLPRVADRIAYVLPLRDPGEVAASLQRRDGFPLRKGYLLWLSHVLEAERATRGAPRLACRFEETLAAPASLYDGLVLSLGLTGLGDRARYLREASAFLDAGLRHHGAGAEDKHGDAGRLAERVHNQLTGEHDDPARAARLDECNALFRQYESEADAALIHHIRSIARDRGAYHLIWRRLQRLYSWRATRPLRGLERLLRDIPANEKV